MIRLILTLAITAASLSTANAGSLVLNQKIPQNEILRALESSDYGLDKLNMVYAKHLPVTVFNGAVINKMAYSITRLEVEASLTTRALNEYSDPTDSLSRFAVDHIYDHVCKVAGSSKYKQAKPNVYLTIYSKDKVVYTGIEPYVDICM